MLYAINARGEKVQATPRGIAFCPVCRRAVVARCGTCKARHWAHKHGEGCDPWFEETAWHLAWKSIVRPESCEVVIRRGKTAHRADIVGNRNTVIELQHSPIAPEEMRAREKFYGKMIWIIDAACFFGNMSFVLKDDYALMAWHYPRTALLTAKKPIYFHLPCGNIFRLECAYPKRRGHPLSGWGRFMGWKPFFHLYFSSVAKQQYSDGLQPDIIKDRRDIELSRLKFHHSSRLTPRCDCGLSPEYSNCNQIVTFSPD
ncbi:Competence protein [Methanocella conradii HZ254]|uniref:Competence protein n=1 Tax=Methanocella conradii (strain DSM 24694 / JCM 17849 / CGMCC 1.5162 / HZ254) TaxID=1041930 RepID=H8I7T5_METCZ|nr:competence protein CoiA family protein [Methanocella conradii]AFC99920.1 Competence protein [Methanocella conradii HZ254]MDI6897267.1 competence protein CoiA family protein [Methanocella conradii]